MRVPVVASALTAALLAAAMLCAPTAVADSTGCDPTVTSIDTKVQKTSQRRVSAVTVKSSVKKRGAKHVATAKRAVTVKVSVQMHADATYTTCTGGALKTQVTSVSASRSSTVTSRAEASSKPLKRAKAARKQAVAGATTAAAAKARRAAMQNAEKAATRAARAAAKQAVAQVGTVGAGVDAAFIEATRVHVYDLINAYRVEQGREPLRRLLGPQVWTDQWAAYISPIYMDSTGAQLHSSSKDRLKSYADAGCVIVAQGRPGASTTGENLGGALLSDKTLRPRDAAQQVFTAWKNSPNHDSNLRNSAMNHSALGAAWNPGKRHLYFVFTTFRGDCSKAS